MWNALEKKGIDHLQLRNSCTFPSVVCQALFVVEYSDDRFTREHF